MAVGPINEVAALRRFPSVSENVWIGRIPGKTRWP